MKLNTLTIIGLFLVLGCSDKQAPEHTEKEIQTPIEKYNQKLNAFIENETEALKLFEIIGNEYIDEAIDYIDNTSMDSWYKNIKIIGQMKQIDNLPDSLQKETDLLKKYCDLRVEQLNLFKAALVENSEAYNDEIQISIEKIDAIVEKL